MRLNRRIDARRPTVRAASAHRAELLKAGFLTGIALLAGAVWSNRAQADADLNFDPALSAEMSEGHYARFSTALPGTQDASAHRTELRDQDLSSFSGVGMIVCTTDGVSRSSTAFLVGAFDIAVTVAHTFQSNGDAQPHCVYNSVDSLGQIRERIPVAYIKSQWEVEAGASGELSKDLAFVRLTHPSRYA